MTKNTQYTNRNKSKSKEFMKANISEAHIVTPFYLDSSADIVFALQRLKLYFIFSPASVEISDAVYSHQYSSTVII